MGTWLGSDTGPTTGEVLVDGTIATFNVYDQSIVDQSMELASIRVGDTLVFNGDDGSTYRSTVHQLIDTGDPSTYQ